MPRYVGYLSAVLGFGGVCEVLRLLVGITAAHTPLHGMREMERQTDVHIHAAYLYIADIHHLPTVLAVASRHRYNLIAHGVIVTICFQPHIESRQSRGLYSYRLRILDAAVNLLRILGLQGGIQDVVV